MRIAKLPWAAVLIASLIGCGEEPEPRAEGWPDVACAGQTVREVLDRIEVLAGPDRPGVRALAGMVVSESPGSLQERCAALADALLSAEEGEWGRVAELLGGSPGGALPLWPDVACEDGPTAAEKLDDIAARAAKAGMAGVINLVDQCRTHPTGDAAVHCGHVTRALDAAEGGDWGTCAVELVHIGAAPVTWPNVACESGMSAAAMLGEIRDLALQATKPGVVQLVLLAGDRTSADRAADCKRVHRAWNHAREEEWDGCSTQLVRLLRGLAED